MKASTFDTLNTGNTNPDIPAEVTHAPIDVYSEAALAGRLTHYRREGLLERDPIKRDAWKGEQTRTEAEIERRRTERAEAAHALFR